MVSALRSAAATLSPNALHRVLSSPDLAHQTLVSAAEEHLLQHQQQQQQSPAKTQPAAASDAKVGGRGLVCPVSESVAGLERRMRDLVLPPAAVLPCLCSLRTGQLRTQGSGEGPSELQAAAAGAGGGRSPRYDCCCWLGSPCKSRGPQELYNSLDG